MSQLGQTERTQSEQMFSGLPLKADIAQYSRHLKGAKGGLRCNRKNRFLYKELLLSMSRES
jgi:hypothetical protein